MGSLASAVEVHAQRYRAENDLGREERVEFNAFKNGEALEFSWQISSTRQIKSVELSKGHPDKNDITWTTVKSFEDQSAGYVDTDPELGELHYRLRVIGADGTVREYLPTFKLKKDDA